MAKVLLSNNSKLTILWLELIEITSQKDLNLRRIAKKIIKKHKKSFNHRKNTRGV
jgi:ribosomal protein L17